MGKYKSQSDLHFYFHEYFFKLRDFFFPRIQILKEADIKPGFCVVDYGCGSGSYIASLSKMVENRGKVLAVDAHPLAIKKVKTMILTKQLKNVETICSDCETGLPDNSIDLVLLYDVFHALTDPAAVLGELYRILKPNGVLSFQDHRANNKTITDSSIKQNFQLLKKNKKTYTFQKV